MPCISINSRSFLLLAFMLSYISYEDLLCVQGICQLYNCSHPFHSQSSKCGRLKKKGQPINTFELKWDRQ